MTWPLRYYHKWYALSDRHTYAQLCRFFTDDVLRTVDEINVAGEAPAGRRGGSEPPFDVELDVAERVRQMWESYDV